MKIVVFGCQQIGVDVLNYLSNRDDIEVSLVITYELPLDKTYGYESVLDYCREKNIEVIMPKSVTRDVVQQLVDISPDMILSIYYRKILPQSVIDIPKLGCINIHPSELPNYRGPVPTAWAIANGEKQFGITIHYVDENIDTGDILVQEVYKIGEDETGYELYTRAMELGYQLFQKNFDDIKDGKITPVPQVGTGSYFGKKGGKCNINWKKSTEDVRNLIRVHAKPFNPAETTLFNRYVLINKAIEYHADSIPLQGGGKIVKILDDGLVVSCADGYLLIQDYEIAPSLTNQEKEIYLKEGNSFG